MVPCSGLCADISDDAFEQRMSTFQEKSMDFEQKALEGKISEIEKNMRRVSKLFPDLLILNMFRMTGMTTMSFLIVFHFVGLQLVASRAASRLFV